MSFLDISIVAPFCPVKDSLLITGVFTHEPISVVPLQHLLVLLVLIDDEGCLFNNLTTIGAVVQVLHELALELTPSLLLSIYVDQLRILSGRLPCLGLFTVLLPISLFSHQEGMRDVHGVKHLFSCQRIKVSLAYSILFRPKQCLVNILYSLVLPHISIDVSLSDLCQLLLNYLHHRSPRSTNHMTAA